MIATVATGASGLGTDLTIKDIAAGRIAASNETWELAYWLAENVNELAGRPKRLSRTTFDIDGCRLSGTPG